MKKYNGIWRMLALGLMTSLLTTIGSAQTTVTLPVTADAWLRQGNPTYNNGGNIVISHSPNTSSRHNSLYLWDLTSIPTSATITEASITFYVTESSAYDFSIFSMRRNWVEGTNTNTAGTGASWTYYGAGTGNWGTSGAMNTSSDRNTTDLWNATASTFGTTGLVTIPLNASGISVLQEWVANSTSNHGLTIQFTGTGTTSDYWIVASKENSSGYTVPSLNITYSNTTPTISTTGTLSAFSSPVNTPSTAQTYTVAGSNLTEDISIAAPTGFEISTDGTNYYSGLTLTQSGGSVSATTIYARLNSSTAGTYNGNITHASTDATTRNIEVSGTVSVYYSLAVNASNGTVALSPAGGSYASGTVVTLTATGNTGYVFSAWTGDLTGSTNPTTITVDGDKSVTATFAVAPPWTAYNDCLGTNSITNTTSITIGSGTTGTSGVLKNFSTGVNTTVSAQFTSSIALTNQTTSGSATNSGTDAYTTFNTKANLVGLVQYNTSNIIDWWEDLTLTGLDPAKTYTFATTANRNSSGYTDRITRFTLSGDEGASNASTSGTGSVNDHSVYFCTGYNTLNGYVARWTGIQPGSDGTIVIRAQPHTSVFEAYAFSVFMLQEEAATGPTITTTGTLSAFSSQPGVPSTAQTYTISGSNLTEDINISAPTGFEISTDGSLYGSSLTLNQTSGSVVSTTIYARLNSATEGTFGGNIAHTSTDATTKNLSASGTVLYVYTLTAGNDGNGTVSLSPSGGSYNNGTIVTLTPVANIGYEFSSWSGTNVGDIENTSGIYTIVINGNKSITANFAVAAYTTVNLVASEDTWLRSSQPTINYGATTPLQANGGSNPQVSLLRWNLSSLPSNATITAASITIEVVTEGTSQQYYLYDLLRSWVEGTNDGTAGTGASWTYWDAGVNQWSSAGAQGSTDRNSTNLWSATTSSFASIGSKTVDLNTSGVAVLQEWYNTPASNHGLTIQNTSASSDYLYYSSSEGTTPPKLNITYTVPSGTTYTLAVSNDGNGSVNISPTGGTYTEGTVVTLTPTANSGYQFAHWSGTNDSDPEDNGNGTWSLTMDSNKSLLANFTLLPVNVAPNQPVLVQPADAATGIAISPTLQVTASDANTSDLLSVSFFGRLKGETTSSEDFTIIGIPDTQNEAQYYPTVMSTQFQWIANQKSTRNIAFATCMGDIVNTASSSTQYSAADAAYDYLDAGNVPYSVGPGNHDVGGLYETYFGVSRFTGKSWYGGHYGSDNQNNYSLFSASGNDFILINLQYSAATAQLDWADALLKANADRRGIVVQHNILNTDNSWNNQTPYTALKDNPNLFLMLCGHMHTSSDGAAYRSELGDDGHTIHIMMADYQDFPNGGNGYLRILRFSPSDDKIYGTTYSPSIDSYITSTTNYDQMEMVYDLDNGSVATYELIGTVTGVTNGSNASISWPGLSQNTDYEWYASVSDGSLATTGSTWSFTTGTNYTLTATDDGNGTVTFAPTGGTYLSGTAVTLTPTPDAGYVFSSWSGINASDIDNTGGVYTIVMNGNKSVTANFAPIQYTLNVTNEGSGSVTLNPTGGTYPSGTTVTLTPLPGTGYQFNSWSGTDAGDIINDNGTFTIILDENKTIIANFIQIQYTLSISTEGNGSVAKDPDKATYTYGETVELTATPETGYAFAGWSGGLSGSDNPATIIITGNTTVTGSYTPIVYNLTVSVNGEGTTSPAAGVHSYAQGTVVDLTAYPAAGYQFVNWTGDVADPNADTTTVTLDAAKTVAANFTQITHDLTMAVTGSGTTTPAAGTYTYVHGEVVPITAIPASGYQFVNWTGQVADASSATTTVTMDVAKTVTANFAQVVFELTMAITGSGTTMPSVGTHNYAQGDVVTIWAVPANGYQFVNWSGDVADPNTDTTTVTMDAARTVTANFTQITHDITMAVTGNGTTAPAAGIHTYVHGEVVSISAFPASGYYFVNWSGDVANPDSPNTEVTVFSAKTVTANFAQIVFELNMSVIGNGTTSPAAGIHNFAKDDVVEIIAFPATGYEFTNWTGDVADVNSDSTTVMMNAAKTVTANFTAQEYTLTVIPIGNGSVAKSPDQATYHYGDVVTLNAVPASGNTFDSWSGDLNGTANPATLTIIGNNIVTATFAENTPVPLGVEGPAKSGTAANNSTSISITHTTGTSTDRLMLVGVSWNCGSTSRNITSVTFTPSGGSATDLTAVITQQAGTQLRYSAIYRLLNPPSGVTGVLTINFSGTVSNGIIAGAVNFAGVNQATPLGTAGGAGSTSQGTAIALTLNGLNGNEILFDNVFAGASSSSQTLTAGSNQSQLWNDLVGSTRAASSTKQASSGSNTLTWTAGSNAYWAIAAVPINPAFTIPNYDLIMTVTGSGTITPAPGTHAYAQGTVVDISAVPAAGYQFVNWTGEVANTSLASTTVTMDATKTVTANFALEEYSLTVNTSGSGSVNVSPAQPSYHNGDVVSLTAIPSAGNTFDGWSGSLGGNPNPTTITISGNMSITANFSEYIPVPLVTDGSASSNAADDVSTIQIPHTTGTGTDRLMLVGVSWNCGTTDRTISSVTYTPANGIATSLTSVMKQQAGTQLRYSAIYSLLNTPRNTSGIVTITFSGVVTNGIVAGAANFAGVNQSTPLGIAGGAGSTTQGTEPAVILTGLNGNELVFDNVFQGANDETQTLAAGNDQTQLWNAYAGSVRAASSTEQASSASATMSWTAGTSAYWAIAAVPINPAITVTNYDLTMGVTGNGTITPVAGTYTYAQGTVVDISATPATGYQFVNWTGEVTNVNSAITTVTMDATKTVTANFVEITYDLTMGVTGNGTITPVAGTYTYAQGTVVDISATPATGYQFVNWTGEVANVNSAITTVTMDAIKTVTANFVEITYDLTMGVTGNGTITPVAGTYTYAQGTVVDISATPATGYQFVNWTGEVANVNSAITTVTMDAIKTVTANFVEITYDLTMGVTGNGTITPVAGTYTYAQGTVVDISATPASGYQFVNWTGEVTNVNSSITTVTMDATKTVTANFVLLNSITVTSPNGGEIWQVGSSHDITWTTTGTIGGIHLAYSTDGSVWTDIIAGTGNTGTYSWTIPAGLAAGSTYMIRVSETDGEPSDISNAAFTLFIASVNQEIILLQGWNIFSLYVTPENIDMQAIVQPIIDAGKLIKVQNQTGDAIERDTDNEWFNDIGDWNSSEGYKIKVNDGTTLTVTGVPITDPVTIELESGWNIISYPVSTSYDAMGVMNSLIVSGHLTKVQDEAGDAIERDLDGEWFNDIGSFDPDEGYKVRLSADDILSIDPALYESGSTLKSTKGQNFPSTLKSSSSAHFRPVWTGNGLDQMNVYITVTNDRLSAFEPGDEIGIFDGSRCVGSGVIMNAGAALQSFVVSADDPTTDEIDGFIAGNRISLKIWRPATNAEAVITDPEFMTKNSKVFESMGTSMIRINMAAADLNPFPEKKTSLGDIYPNPFNHLATIPFTMAEESYVDIAIYNVLGERVNTLVHGTLSVGNHTTVWDATNAGNVGAMPGLYFCKMIVKNEVFVKRIELIDHQ